MADLGGGVGHGPLPSSERISSFYNSVIHKIVAETRFLDSKYFFQKCPCDRSSAIPHWGAYRPSNWIWANRFVAGREEKRGTNGKNRVLGREVEGEEWETR